MTEAQRVVMVLSGIVMFMAGTELIIVDQKNVLSEERNGLLSKCESTLPRTQHCKLVAVVDGEMK